MTLKINTETIDLEYTSESSGISEWEKKYIIEILDKIYTAEEKKTLATYSKNHPLEDLKKAK